jgi:predicted transcriptional regulator
MVNLRECKLVHYRNEAQVRFANLFQKSGLTKSQVARLLGMSPTMVTLVLQAQRTPKEVWLESFERKIGVEAKARAHVAEIESRLSSSKQLHQQLRDLEKTAPEKFDVARTVIESLSGGRKKKLRKKKINSTPAEIVAADTKRFVSEQKNLMKPALPPTATAPRDTHTYPPVPRNQTKEDQPSSGEGRHLK